MARRWRRPPVATRRDLQEVELDVRAYLAELLPRLLATGIERVRQLTPARGAGSRGG